MWDSWVGVCLDLNFGVFYQAVEWDLVVYVCARVRVAVGRMNVAECGWYEGGRVKVYDLL